MLQVDWYCCNVGPYHAMRAMDPSVGVADDEDIKRWVVDEDGVVAGAVAKAVGMDGLDALDPDSLVSTLDSLVISETSKFPLRTKLQF